MPSTPQARPSFESDQADLTGSSAGRNPRSGTEIALVKSYQTAVTTTAFSGLFRAPHSDLDPLHHAGSDGLPESSQEVALEVRQLRPPDRFGDPDNERRAAER